MNYAQKEDLIQKGVRWRGFTPSVEELIESLPLVYKLDGCIESTLNVWRDQNGMFHVRYENVSANWFYYKHTHKTSDNLKDCLYKLIMEIK